MLLTSQWIVKMNFLASAHAGMRGNMKRKIAWILLAAMTLSIAACGNKTGDSVADDGNITAEATEGALDTSANLEGSCADILDEIIKQQKQMTITSATQMILKTWRLPKQKKNIF